MNALRAYQHYLALKKHFSDDKYDVFQAPRVPVPETTFLKRNDKRLWEVFADNFPEAPQLMDFMVANFAYGNPTFLYDMELAEVNFKQWVSNKQNITYRFETELQTIRDVMDQNKITPDRLLNFQGPSPAAILSLFLGKHVSLETMVILNSGIGYIDQWKGQMSTFFSDEIRRLEKSQKFVKFNKETVKGELDAFKEDLKMSV